MSGGEVLLEVLGAGGAGDWQRVLGSVQLPSEGDLLGSGVVLLGDRVDRGVERVALVSLGDGARVPGDKTMPASWATCRTAAPRRTATL